MGATTAEIKRINETLDDLVKRAGIKVEDKSNKISLLRKIEVKFQKLVEKRQIFSFFDNATLLKKEKEVKDKVSQENYKMRMRYQQEAADAADAKAQQKIDKKQTLKVARNIRMVARSKKEEL